MSHGWSLGVVSGEDRSPVAGLVRVALGAAEPAYAAAVRRRNRAFDRGGREATDLGRPTISVGNLTTGGTGKTPMVVELCRRLAAMGQRPAVLLRGYKSVEGRSDEAQELGEALPGCVVMPNPSRVAGAAAVLAEDPATTCFVLDDGFQHRQAARDVDVVLIDATNPWGFGRLLPRGLLREPKAGLARADAVIVTRADLADCAPIDEEVERLTGSRPLAHAAHTWTGFMNREEARPADALAPMRVVGVSGIGNPEAFERALEQHALQVLEVERRPDHHAWSGSEIAGLLDRAKRRRADGLVTTEKDYVKWRPWLEAQAGAPAVPILRPVLGLRFLDGGPRVDTLLGSVFEGRT